MEPQNRDFRISDPWASEFDLSDVRQTDAPVQPIFCPPTTLGREYLHTASVFFGVFMIFVGTILGQIGIAFLLRLFGIDYRENDVAYFLLSVLPMYAIGLPLSLIVFRQGKVLPPKPNRRISFGAMVCLFCACLSLSLVGSMLGNLANGVLEFVTGKTSESPVEELTRNTPFWLNFLLVAIVAPVMEELIYRKLVIDRLRRYGDICAVFGSALLFGAIHGNFSQFYYALLVGIVLGWIYTYSGKVRYSMILHILFNTLGVVSSELVRLAGGMDAAMSSDRPLWLTMFLLADEGLYLLSFVGTILAGVLLIRKLRPQKPTVYLTGKQKLFLLFLNPTLWALVILILLLSL